MLATSLGLGALLAAVPTRPLYPTSAALRTGKLPVSDTHVLYYEVHGRKGGTPALFLHGGPGAGCFTRHAGFFDPAHYQVVLFDQRGCGRSTPKGELEANDTPNLVQDCERLREHLDFERWAVVLGGSWGTTLALAYAGEYPHRIGAMVLRAVCTMRAQEMYAPALSPVLHAAHCSRPPCRRPPCRCPRTAHRCCCLLAFFAITFRAAVGPSTTGG